MSEESQLRISQAKKSLLAAGKKAQEEKDAAKAAYQSEKDMGIVSESQSAGEWALMNYPSLQVSYQEYQARQAQYTRVLHQYDESAAKEWQEARKEAFGPLSNGEPFEKDYFIYLPEE